MHLDVDKVSSAKDRKRTLVSRRIKGFTAEHRVFRNNNNIIYSVEPLFKQGASFLFQGRPEQNVTYKYIIQ